MARFQVLNQVHRAMACERGRCNHGEAVPPPGDRDGIKSEGEARRTDLCRVGYVVKVALFSVHIGAVDAGHLAENGVRSKGVCGVGALSRKPFQQLVPKRAEAESIDVGDFTIEVEV